MHLTAEVKPWNFYSKHHPNWRYEFDSELAWLWTERKIKKVRRRKTPPQPDDCVPFFKFPLSYLFDVLPFFNLFFTYINNLLDNMTGPVVERTN
jgi:hypothetical protein